MIKKALAALFFSMLFFTLNGATITVNTASQRAGISPLIYGTDQQMEGDENLTCMRLGGNRMTGYNWENNASSAGNDWYNNSDDYMCGAIEYPVSATECASVAGAVIDHWNDYCISHGYKSIITIPMAGYVAADKAGEVFLAETAPSARWKQVIDVKGSAFQYPPNTADNYVYNDEEVWHLVQKYGNASTPTGVLAYQLDNEADIWDGTHPRIHPTPVGAAELVNRSISLATAIKNVDQFAQVFGPVFAMIWSEDATGDSIDWPGIKTAGGYSWYVDYYLDRLRQASTTEGKRLLDAIDIHYYTESSEGLYPPYSYASGCRITSDTCNSAGAQLSRLQAARTLWDPAFIENSNVGEWLQADLPLLPKLQASINAYYPGTKIAVTEHGFGGGTDYSGGICLADVLGVFGKYGVYVATMWKSGYGIYHSAAYKLYRNYNGANAVYGDTKVQCDSNDIPNMTTYASINGSDESVLHIIILNKAATAQTANVNITSGQAYTMGAAWGFDASSANITSRTAPVIAGNSFSYSMPAHTAYHFILSSNMTPTNTPNWTKTITPTNTPNWSATITPTFTITPDSLIIYDGDTSGARLSDGTVTANRTGGTGTMAETTGGNPGNEMKLTYTAIPAWWEEHLWHLNNPKAVAGYGYLVFNIRQDPASPNAVNTLRIRININLNNPDVADYLEEGGVVDTTWKTVRIPLSDLLDPGQTTIADIYFAANWNMDYTVDIDNMRLETGGSTPTISPSRTSTWTRTFTATRTATPTQTQSSTGSATQTFTPTRTFTLTQSLTHTQTFTLTQTQTFTWSATQTFTPSQTQSFTKTATPTFTGTRTQTFTRTMTVTRTVTPTWTESPDVSPTNTVTGTPPTPTFTDTVTPTVTETITDTVTETETSVDTRTETPVDTAAITETDTPVPTATAAAPSATESPAVTGTFTETPIPTTPTITPTITPTTTHYPPSTITEPGTYPNPYAVSHGDLTAAFELQNDAATVYFKIYTRAFRLVKQVRWTNVGQGLATRQVEADKLKNLSSGIYMYIIEAVTRDNVIIKSKIGTLVIYK